MVRPDTPDAPPLVSVGVPVFNGERFLESTVRSLLDQDYPELEIIISDNASTDATPDICSRLAAEDARIQVHRHPENRGAAFNWNFVLSRARGPYFKWASDNDRYHPAFVSRCTEVLENQPDVVLCYARTVLVDGDDREIETDHRDQPIVHDRAADRFAAIMNHRNLNNAQSGVIRLEVLRRTRGERRYPHGDWVLMAELAGRGKFQIVEAPLFYRRIGKAGLSTERLAGSGTLATFIDASRTGPARCRTWSEQYDYLASALRLPISPTEKVRLAAHVIGHAGRRWRTLLGELRGAAGGLVRRTGYRNAHQHRS